MTTREEFLELVQDHAIHGEEYTEIKILDAWDRQAAQVEAARAEVEAWKKTAFGQAAEVQALRVGVPLTAENAPRARVVETADGVVLVWSHAVTYLLDEGATVLAWRK